MSDDTGSSAKKPFWSVMIPAYNPRPEHLEKALSSVLCQRPSAREMQIEVVDDCSPAVDVPALVRRLAGHAVKVTRTKTNLGLAGSWNTCIERANGVWLHILHQDDFVLPGFYGRLQEVIAAHPTIALAATRSFTVDDDGHIQEATHRVPALEKGSKNVADFFYGTPIQCPGIAVKTGFYRQYGGFSSVLKYTLDCEMWARVIAQDGGAIVPDVLACYRVSGGNESSRLLRNGDAWKDCEMLSQLFGERYARFDPKKARLVLCQRAHTYAERFEKIGDKAAAKTSWNYWRRHAPFTERVRVIGSRLLRRFSNP